jgi:hypothetical protein
MASLLHGEEQAGQRRTHASAVPVCGVLVLLLSVCYISKFSLSTAQDIGTMIRKLTVLAPLS